IRSIAREGGERTKIAVYSKDEKVDPVGSCVGMRGSRVKDIVRELHGERVDIVRWNENIEAYLKNALSPAEVKKVKIDKENNRIEAIVKDDQLSIGIGKHGQNVRLASRLVGWEVDIRGENEVKEKAKKEKVLVKKKEKGISISKIKGVGKKAEKVLAGAGFNTTEKIASSEVNELTKLEGIGKKGAERIIASAKELLEAK
ncbi:MAG: KH domain-containing protein, partial [Candidatus Omnitrophica bacterium]|nr:KH domain-containing protein [Candidatus Omnitrophota bacterium]